jgi:hypothetical protein
MKTFIRVIFATLCTFGTVIAAAGQNLSSQSPSTVAPSTPNLTTTSPSPATWQDDAQKYQTLLVGFCTFLIGLMTVTNAFVTTYLNHRNRKSDEQRKKLAFFATLEQELSTIREQLQTSSEILQAFKTDQTAAIQWLSTVRIASRISPLRSLDHDWEKLYVIGIQSIRLLRQLTLSLQDLDSTFQDVLSDQDTIRSQSLPLFQRLSAEEEREKILSNLEILQDLIDSTKLQSDNLLQMLAVDLGVERNALDP